MIDETTDLEQVKAALKIDKAALQQRECELEQETIRRMEVNHGELVAQCRAAQDALAALNDEVENAKSAWYQAGNAVGRMESRLVEHRLNKPNDYPLPREIAAREATLTELQSTYAAALDEHGSAWQVLDKLQNDRKQAHRAFEDLKEQEHNSRAEIIYERAALQKLQPASASGTPRREVWQNLPDVAVTV